MKNCSNLKWKLLTNLYYKTFIQHSQSVFSYKLAFFKRLPQKASHEAFSQTRTPYKKHLNKEGKHLSKSLCKNSHEN